MADPNPNPNPDPNPPRNPVLVWLNKSFARHALLALGMIALILIVSKYSRDFAEEKAIEWLNMYNGQTSSSDDGTKLTHVETINANASPSPAANSNTAESQTRAAAATNANANVAQTQAGDTATGGATQPGGQQPPAAAQPTPTLTPPPSITEPQQQRLSSQLRDVRARIRHHGTVMAFFYKAYYMSISVVMLSALIAALALFFIAQNGWTGTNPYVKNVFLVMTAAAAYYGLFPSVFKQEQNISDNKALFLSYKALENEVISYPLTGTDLKGEKKTTQEFINYVDAQMTALGKIAIGFDDTKVSYKGVFDITERPSGGAANVNQNPNTNRPGNRNQ